jgi:hypothetical protein
LSATKHICSTCGQQLQAKKPESGPAEEITGDEPQRASGEQKTMRSFWKSLFSAT